MSVFGFLSVLCVRVCMCVCVCVCMRLKNGSTLVDKTFSAVLDTAACVQRFAAWTLSNVRRIDPTRRGGSTFGIRFFKSLSLPRRSVLV